MFLGVELYKGFTLTIIMMMMMLAWWCDGVDKIEDKMWTFNK